MFSAFSQSRFFTSLPNQDHDVHEIEDELEDEDVFTLFTVQFSLDFQVIDAFQETLSFFFFSLVPGLSWRSAF